MTDMVPSPIFAHPAPALLQWKYLEGSLVVIQPLEVIKALPTQHGVRRATRSHVFVVDGPQAGVSYRDAMIFPGGIQQVLASHVGELVLGRVTAGIPDRDSFAPPWLLLDVSDDSEAISTATDAIMLAVNLPFNL